MLPKHHRVFVFFLVFYELAVYLSVDASLSALPQIAKAFPHHTWPIAYTLTGWYLGSALTPLLLGPLTEHLGYRRTLLLGGAVFLGATLTCTLTQTFTWFIIARVLQGACVSAVITPGYGTIHHLLDQKQAIKTTAWMSAITVLAPSAGPMVGAVILQFFNWRWIFASLFSLALVCLIGLYSRMPALKTTSHDYDAKLPTLCRQYWRILCARNYLRYKTTQCLLFAALIAWITTSPMLLMETFGFNAVQFSWSQAVIFGCYIVGTKCVKHLLDRWKPTQFLKTTIAGAVVCSLLAAGMGYQYTAHPWPLIVCTAGIALGVGSSMSSLDRLSVECSDQPMGMRIAMGGFLFSVFGFLGSLSASIIGHTQLWHLGTLMCALVALAMALMPRTSRGT